MYVVKHRPVYISMILGPYQLQDVTDWAGTLCGAFAFFWMTTWTYLHWEHEFGTRWQIWRAMSVEQTSAVSVAYPRNTQYVQESESDSESSDEEMVQTAGDFFEARENGTGPLDKKYERVAPEHFSTGSDDLFMKSMIMNYSQEGKDKDGAPNGQFFMTEAQTKAAAAEVLGSHKGLDGPAKAEYLKTYFPRTWAHYDVNKAGMIGVETMP
jgi:hypothetical protein